MTASKTVLALLAAACAGLLGCSGARPAAVGPEPMATNEPVAVAPVATTPAPTAEPAPIAESAPKNPWYCVGTSLTDTKGNVVKIEPMCFSDQGQCDAMAADMKKESSTLSVSDCAAANEVYCHTTGGQRNVCFGTTVGCEEERMAANEGECVVTAAK